MRATFLLVTLLLPACSVPRFQASKIVEMEIPVAQAIRLHCKTHNGAIKVMRGDSANTVHVHAELTARGHSQGEADVRLGRIDVGVTHDGDTLRIFGEYPHAAFAGDAPTFSFTLLVPEHMALTLRSHNGGVATTGTTGPVDIETHNGAVAAMAASTSARVKTHNGAVCVLLDADDALDTQIETHNGGVLVALHGGCHGWLTAETHNGRLSLPAGAQEATVERRSMRCRIGSETTTGKLDIRSHNGAIEVQ